MFGVVAWRRQSRGCGTLARMARMIFTGGQIFDGTGSPLRDAHLAVEDGRIVDTGSRLDADTAIEVPGKTRVPGLFDCHTHVAFTHLDLLKRLETPFSCRPGGASPPSGCQLTVSIRAWSS